MVTSRFTENKESFFAVREMKTDFHTILYVDDNPENLLVVTQLISRRQDTELLPAINSDLEILIAKTHRPSVILVDINLLEMNGIDAIAILRGDPATLYIPVIALTSKAFPKYIENGINVGLFLYIAKPFF